MSRKRTIYSTEVKTKLVLELLKGDNTIAEIANKHNITPKKLTKLESNIYRKCRNGNGTWQGDEGI